MFKCHLKKGVSKNTGTPKSWNLTRFSLINHPFWDTTIFGSTPKNKAPGLLDRKSWQIWNRNSARVRRTSTAAFDRRRWHVEPLDLPDRCHELSSCAPKPRVFCPVFSQMKKKYPCYIPRLWNISQYFWILTYHQSPITNKNWVMSVSQSRVP